MTNPSLVSYHEISKFLTESFTDFQVNYLSMGRVYRNGSLYSMAQDASWAFEHMVINKSPPAGLITFDEVEGKQLMLATDQYDNAVGWPEGTRHHALERHNIRNLLTVFIKKNDYIDQYMVDIHNSDATNIYLNKLPLIELMIQSTLHQFKGLVKDIKKQPLIADKKFVVMQKLKSQQPMLSSNEYLLYQNDQLVKVTAREHDCLECLAKGARVKDIARKLAISPRTVETHLNRLKSKLGIYSLSGLTSCYWDNREFSFD